MDRRAKSIVKILILCLFASVFAAIAKLFYGYHNHALAFIADGIHSLLDSAATVAGIITVTLASQPPDEEHHYGHRKFETLAAVVLAAFLLFAGFEVGKLAIQRFLNPQNTPEYSLWGLGIILCTMVITTILSRIEHIQAKKLKSPFLAADSVHNLGDLGTDLAVLVSWGAGHIGILYLDGIVALLIAFYLVYLSVRTLRLNMHNLLDAKVLDSGDVIHTVESVEGVLHCHNVRSRGEKNHHFLDLNIHLGSKITLEQAHELTHRVEDILKNKYEGLIDVVIHTEPENHPPCSKGDLLKPVK